MEYGRFIEDGKKYEIVTPLTPAPWSNCLYNDSYYLEVSQTLQGAGYLVEDYNRRKCISDYRYFYLADRESGEVWNPNYIPLAKKPDSYSCVHGIWTTELKSRQQGIETSIQVMVTPNESREIWSVTLYNAGNEAREISLYSIFGFDDHGVMGGECVYDADAEVIVKYAFPYHTLYEEKEKVETQKAYYYVFPSQTPNSCEMSKMRFFGNQGENAIPDGVKNGKLSGIKGEAEDFCGAFSFDITIPAGEKVTLHLEAGAALDKAEIIARKDVFDQKAIQQAEAETDSYWKEAIAGFYLETPDKNLNAFGNYWLKKQITLLTRQNRGSSYCPVRNQLQDALGYAMIQPEKAETYILDVMKLQNSNGFIQQWHDTTGAPPRGLCLLTHTDGPVWLVICTEALIRQCGSRELLERQIGYADGSCGSVWEHLKVALIYLTKNVGKHGLCLIGDGDWNDPMNGAGRDGEGESVWLSMATVYAAKLFLPYLEAVDREGYDEISQAIAKMKVAINTSAWCEKWYAAAIHDDGTLLGSEEDRLFLNTQSWAIMSGVADEHRTKILMETIQSNLATPFGPLLLYPPFEAWDEHWGRISVKKSGTTENGSVYCHASMFLAYAQARIGSGDGLYETLWQTLPTNPNNPPEMNTQLPIYLANYYYGLKDSANFGRSSRHYGTGTVAWMLMLLIEELLGVKATVDGIKIQPCLPHDWKKVACEKRYRDAIYQITIIRGNENKLCVDGIPYENELLPYEQDKTYKIEMEYKYEYR
ncbi:GH36-type glycosyl hydrolase domain-containing protein [Anaerosporobacter sp.]|uniref:GH36-type glycosyl hydrolase domain-containing protein n=1 Tax=Anaerosporobacter sp. TaxID=1872529 RepID=UPI00286F5A98|nr:hypothetical protein [Anaerosporobacter sp.]